MFEILGCFALKKFEQLAAGAPAALLLGMIFDELWKCHCYVFAAQTTTGASALARRTVTYSVLKMNFAAHVYPLVR